MTHCQHPLRSCLAALLLCLCAATALQAQTLSRIRQTLRFGWRFHRGDLPDAARPTLNDEDWERIDLPHDFLISQPWTAPTQGEGADNSDPGNNVRSRLSPRGFKEMGIGWYRLHLTPDSAWRGRRILIDVEGIMLVGDVYLNGERIGGTDYGYLGFQCDVSQLLRFGADNVLAVRADTRAPENSRWYTGGGLYRDVHLVVTDPVMHFERHGLKIETTRVDADGTAHIALQSEITCRRDSKYKRLDLRLNVLDRDGRSVLSARLQPPFRAGQKTYEYVLDTLALPAARLWDVDSPYLYTLRLQLVREDGSVADEVEQRFGVRTLEFSPEFGMKLNGRKVLLKGIANHHTLGQLGAAVYPRALEQRIRLLKAFGFNHLRTSHNPYSESLLDLCDEYGILVVDELYDKWLDRYTGGRRPWTEQWQHDIPEFVKRDRNHPSVVVWSLGNELQTYWDIPYADWGVTAYRMQKVLLQRYDRSRPVTVAMHPRGRDPEAGDSLPAPLARETDIAAYNYRYMYFPGDGRRYPWMIFYQSEANTTMLGPNYFEMDLDRVLGTAYWGMIDYLGESQGWPEKGWAQGVFDITLQPKPAAYLVKSMFSSEEPVVHIGVQETSRTMEWNGIRTGINRTTDHWNRTEGERLTAYTYTNAEEVELLLNGRSLGTRRNRTDDPKERNQIRWNDLPYESGTLEAIARNGGKVVARHRIQTAGPAVRLRLTAEQPGTDGPIQFAADGLDLIHVRIEAIDKKGIRVPSARHDIQLSTTGDVRIAGVGNGDMASDDIHTASHIHLHEGAALVVLRAGRTPGKFTLKAETDGLNSAVLQSATRQSANNLPASTK